MGWGWLGELSVFGCRMSVLRSGECPTVFANAAGPRILRPPGLDLVFGEFEAGDLGVLGGVGAVDGFDVFFDEEGEVDEAGAIGVEHLIAGNAGIAEGHGGGIDVMRTRVNQSIWSPAELLPMMK